MKDLRSDWRFDLKDFGLWERWGLESWQNDLNTSMKDMRLECETEGLPISNGQRKKDDNQ